MQLSKKTDRHYKLKSTKVLNIRFINSGVIDNIDIVTKFYYFMGDNNKNTSICYSNTHDANNAKVVGSISIGKIQTSKSIP